MNHHKWKPPILLFTSAILIILLTAGSSLQAETAPSPNLHEKKLVAYYAAWAAYSGFTPDKIDAEKLTHVNYAFAKIGTDLRIEMGYPDKDPSNYKKLNELKLKNPNLKTLISIGGWTWSDKFSDAALTEDSRKAFAKSCVEFIIKYGFDGIDLDWEYPVSGGLPQNIRRSSDKENFTLLLQKLRYELDKQGTTDKKHYYLTIAAGAGNSFASNIELLKIQQYLDYAIIMTYDLHGPWDAYTDLLAPLYGTSDVSPQYKTSVDSGMNAWIKAPFPLDKLVMGIPFYGYRYTSVKNGSNGLYGRFAGSRAVSYDLIEKNYLNNKAFKRYFHPQSKVPWLFDGSTFVTYEDMESVGYKAKYISQEGIGGAAVWELSQDPNNVLLNKLFEGLK
jgi:Chitinase